MVTQYVPASTDAVSCGDEPGVVLIAVERAHPAIPVVGTPMPRPTSVKGPPALVSVTLTVPACIAVNDRETAPLAVSLLENVLVVGDVGVEGVVVVGVSLPQALVSDAVPTA